MSGMSTEDTAFAELAEGAETGPTAETTNGTRPGSTDGEMAPVVSDSPRAMNDSGREPAVPFLQSLVDAMRKIAEQTRDDAMAQLRAGVAERSAGIRSDTEKRAAELHELADTDVKSVEEWESGEMQRIREDAASRVKARNATLEAQLAANTAAGEGAMTAVEARVDAFEAEMNAFFAQLNDIHDPAALASTLKRIPQAPSLADVAVPAAGETAPTPAPVAATAPEPNATPDEMGEPKQEAAVASAAPSSAPEAAAPDDDASPVAVAVADTAPQDAAADQPEVAAEAPAEAPVEPAAEESTTQVVVTGLTSFGAITSFKQSLERVAGVSRVSLGLGTSGEFIFTAAHREGFDLSAAIQSFEESAQFATSNGQLRVTVGSKA
jgi:hypothetical protein